MDILCSVVLLFLLQAATAVTAKKCYFVQELDHEGKFRWLMPGTTQKERCSCAVLLVGGVNTLATTRPSIPYYTDQPLLTHDVEEVRDYFGCRDESTLTTTLGPIEYADCQAWFDSGRTSSGVYAGTPSGSISPTGGKGVYCDMDKGKGWLVFQRRQDGSVNFNRNWLDYQEGFGDLNGEFWLGNEALRLLTNVDNGSNWTIRVDLTGENGLQISLPASPFRITGDKYTISVGNSGFEGQMVCGEPLGMEDRSITDSSIKASSFFDLSDSDQSQSSDGKGRLNAASSWCPKKEDKQAPWFQVDLYEQTQVAGVTMQGGNCQSGYAGWVKKYKVEYGCDQLKWNYVVGTFLDVPPQFSFDGNTDTDTPVTNMFDEPVQARYIRIRPTEYNTWPTMRIELLGCEGRVLESLSGRTFSTYDNDNDNDVQNCAGLSEAGWWFDDCAVESNLTGNYSHRVNDSCQEYRGILWSTWQGRQIVKSEMKMRRDN